MAEPPSKEKTTVHTRQVSDWNNPFRSLEEEFDKEHQQEGDTPPQILQATPGVGTSASSGPTIDFLHRLMQNSPSFAQEVLKFQKMITQQTEVGEENAGMRTEEGRNEEDRPNKAPAVHVLESEGDSLDERENEMKRLKRQVEQLQERLRDNGRRESLVMEEARRSGRREGSQMEGDTWFETPEISRLSRPIVMSKNIRGNPFASHILEDPLPNHFKPVNYEYDGTTDPEEHVAKFENVALLHQYTEGVKYRVFSTTLVGVVQQWFKQLLSGSIASFEEFYDIFLQQFASARKSVKSSLHLMTVKQLPGESLRDYVAKFNLVALETPAADPKIKIHAFTQGLQSGAFFDSLVMNEPQDFGDLLKRIIPYIHLEEVRGARREEVERSWKRVDKEANTEGIRERERRTPGVPPLRETSRYDKRPRGYQEGFPKETAYPHQPILPGRRSIFEISEKDMIPINQPLSVILNVAKKLSDFYMPGRFTEEIRGTPGLEVCRYHNQYGHTTDQCKNLRILIDKMIRDGKLGQFMKRERGETAPKRGGNPNHLPPPQPPPGVPKQKIYMIFGGEGTGMSNHARKAVVRQARQMEAQVMEIKPGENPEVTFGPQDDRAMLRPHNDALVITADVAGVWVARTFVDTGSSVNIMYYDCLKQLDMNAKLQPPTGSLFGFSGEIVSPVGSIHLPVTLGSPSHNARRMVEFIILDLPNSAYNVILGRPALNEFRAVVSTYYLKMKFPVKGGIEEVYGSQVSSKECYVKAITGGNKRRPVNSKEGEVNKQIKRIHKEETLFAEKDPGKKEVVVCEEPKRLQMEPEGEILTIELFPGNEGFTTRIRKGMRPEIEEKIVVYLRKNADVFAFSPSDLKGIDPAIALHILHEDTSVKPVKQKLRRFGTEKDEVIREEVTKLLKAGHITEVQFPIWLSNVVMVAKSGGKWRMCVDFRDLNRACPKDHYPLPRIDQLVDSTSGCELLSMMDAYQGYNQIKMHPDDVAKTAFRTASGVFGFTSMPFGLKNAGATYQRMMDLIFQKQIGKNMAVYVDDMLVKSKKVEDHEIDLQEVFEVVRKQGLMLNPAKCTFGVKSGKFLGYRVTEQGIEVNKDKVAALMKMVPPRNIKEVQSLNGRITALGRFIARSTEKSLHFYKILRQQGRFTWTEECQEAFEKLKGHLAELPLLVKPSPGEVLILYFAVGEDSVSSVLVKEEDGIQKPVYFTSKVLQGAENRYSEVEKAALAIITTARKLGPYFLFHRVKVRTGFPFQKMLGQPNVSGRMVKWAVELSEYEIEFVPRTAIKAQALADFLQEMTRTAEVKLWKAFVDGSTTKEACGVGVKLVSPEGDDLSFAIRYECTLSNNEAEYEAVIKAAKMMIALGATDTLMFTDSQLVAQQTQGNFEAKEERMHRYMQQLRRLKDKFTTFEIHQIPRKENEEADRLARLATSVDTGKETKVVILKEQGKSIEEEEVLEVGEKKDWRNDIIQYLATGENPKGTPQMARRCARYYLLEGRLFRRGFAHPHLKCLSQEEGEHILGEIHSGCCGDHSGYRSLIRKTIRAGFYWSQLERDTKKVVQTCDSCQKHSRLIHTPGEEMGGIIASCPFDKWGIYIVGKLPTAPGGKIFLIVAIDYFSKRIEAEAVVKIDDSTVQKFLWKNICCRYGIPRILISDNGTQFTSARIQEWCESMSILQRFVSVAHPQANGQVEVSNRTISEGIKKRLEGSKGKWVEELDIVLWAYRTSPREATGETPFALVYGGEAVVPAEIISESPQIETYQEQANGEVRKEELDQIEFKREIAQIRAERYKSQVKAQYNKGVKIRRFQKGDLVLKRADALKPVAKWSPNWEGPFLVTEVLKGGAYHLSDSEGRPWNINMLRKYYI